MNKAKIVVHGGCGTVDESSIPNRLDGVRAAAEAGWAIVRTGGTAIDAVEAAIVILENNPLFNAGTGSTLNRDGRIETDAAIMDGATLAAGGIAGVTGILNPIRLARRVMDDSAHVLLIGRGAERFALTQGFKRCSCEQLLVPYRGQEWKEEHGTVGATACDQRGQLAAATSTGGSFNKMSGRVGDAPLIGCGTYANDRVAVSCTGNGEHIIRMTLARLAAFLHEKMDDAQKACDAALQQLTDRLDGEAGLIAIDLHSPGFTNNSSHMPVCAITEGGVTLTC